MADSNYTPTWKIGTGLNHTPAYQVSGAPYATASLDSNSIEGRIVHFPYVTRWIKIVNKDTSNAVKVAFSARGLATENNYFTVGKGATGQPTSTEILEIKVSEIYLTGSTDVDIIAGLTGIHPRQCQNTTGPNWSGSAGVG
jgi:hypothetical protein